MFGVYLGSGDYAKSFEYAEQLYNIANNSGQTEKISGALISLGKLYSAIEDYPHALNYYRRALGIVKESSKQIFYKQLEFEIAETFAKAGEFDSAWVYYTRYIRRPGEDYRLYLISTGECFFRQGKFLPAMENFETAMKDPISKNDPRILLDMAGIYTTLDNAKASIPYAREGIRKALEAGADQYIRDGYKIISDAFEQLGDRDSSNYYFRKYSVARDIVLNAQMRGTMAAQTYEQEIRRMNQENELREMNLQKQVWLKNLLLGSVAMLLLFAFLWSRYLIVKRRAEIRQRQIVENDLKIQKLEAEKSGALLKQQKTELEIKALRAQMNPHFIFNCLNSINRFIISNDAAKAADYLTKFARLIRIVLEKSGVSLITLDEELKSLVLYMDLEALRFENPFCYEIHAEGIDTEDLLVPSLIIQPFVENAIWHGFQAGQKSQGKIRIYLQLEKDRLLCDILDNGIGISRARAMSQIHREHSKSFGIQFTKERLQLLSKPDAASVILAEDLKDVDGEIIGTRVHIEIPVSLN